MPTIDHFSYGWLTPVVAYLMSFTGSLLGLRCMARARSASMRDGWMVAAAVAIGGTGIWVMHFIAMLGFTIDGASIRYNVPITLVSALIAMVVVWIGLGVAQRRTWGPRALLIGGAITGAGVGTMHYCGMYAMKSDAALAYNGWIVLASMVIAVIAATAALWFTLHVRGTLATVGAAAVMGVAVSGMHYTGMFAMRVHDVAHTHQPSGAGAGQLLTPLTVGVSMLTVVLLLHLAMTDAGEPETRTTRPRRPAQYWPTRE
ncbi:MHYT domain-containing protein [Nocardia cyriacigeorgica]|uniref:MHYT domain-containing protein n=1 Tax=Nocardia cyriacigeorgica TaxID=135487 RepID=UPI002457366B|nr:MHYT domain-containing protein [Nocardia cyriacigeorgica]